MSGFKITNIKNLKAALNAKPGNSSFSTPPKDGVTTTSTSTCSCLSSVPFISYFSNEEIGSITIPSTLSSIPTIEEQITQSNFPLTLSQTITEGRYLKSTKLLAKNEICLIEIPFAWFNYQQVNYNDHKLLEYLGCHPNIPKQELIERFLQLEPVYSRYLVSNNGAKISTNNIHPVQLIAPPIHTNAFQTRTYIIPEHIHTKYNYHTLDSLQILLKGILDGTIILSENNIRTNNNQNNYDCTLPLQLCMGISSMFNHSCIPNITYISIILQSSSSSSSISLSSFVSYFSSNTNNNETSSLQLPFNIPILIFYTLDTVQKDEILYHSYIDPTADVQDRQIRLWEGYSFTCLCSKCETEKVNVTNK